MSEMQLYARVFVKILDSSIAEDFTLRHVFEDFLKLAEHKTGVVDMTRQSVSRRLNIPGPILDDNIAKLESPDPASRDPDFEGRRIEKLDSHRDWGWRILNWEKYEGIKTRADAAERVSRHRENRKQSEMFGESFHEEPKPFKELVTMWSAAFKSQFGFDYDFNGGKDGKAVKDLIKLGIPASELVNTARQAWVRSADDKFAKDCKQASTIHGFRHALNQIRVELKNGAKINGVPQAGPKLAQLVKYAEEHGHQREQAGRYAASFTSYWADPKRRWQRNGTVIDWAIEFSKQLATWKAAE